MPEIGDGTNLFSYNGRDLEVTDVMKEAFGRDGYVVVKNLLSKDELDIVEEAVSGPEFLTTHAYDVGPGKEARMCLWSNAGHDTTGNLARTLKLSGTASQLLGGEVYHYHSKLVMKDGGGGGQVVWHQDYGYWYKYGCLFPDMLTAFIAIDRCGRDNGCLQVLKGSHRCGRIEHSPVAGQFGADPARVSELHENLDKVYVELSPGDAVFFHCNLLHASTDNDSQVRRWALLTAYNRKSNNPTVKFCAQYSPLALLSNDAVTKNGVSRDLAGKGFMTRDDGIYIP